MTRRVESRNRDQRSRRRRTRLRRRQEMKIDQRVLKIICSHKKADLTKNPPKIEKRGSYCLNWAYKPISGVISTKNRKKVKKWSGGPKSMEVHFWGPVFKIGIDLGDHHQNPSDHHRPSSTSTIIDHHRRKKSSDRRRPRPPSPKKFLKIIFRKKFSGKKSDHQLLKNENRKWVDGFFWPTDFSDQDFSDRTIFWPKSTKNRLFDVFWLFPCLGRPPRKMTPDDRKIEKWGKSVVVRVSLSCTQVRQR